MSQLFNELFNVNLNIVAAGPSRPCRAGGEELERWLRVAARHAGRLRKRVFLSHLYIKMITLPRQARDKHRESTQKSVPAFPYVGIGMVEMTTDRYA
jgi:hypothetical protein